MYDAACAGSREIKTLQIRWIGNLMTRTSQQYRHATLGLSCLVILYACSPARNETMNPQSSALACVRQAWSSPVAAVRSASAKPNWVRTPDIAVTRNIISLAAMALPSPTDLYADSALLVWDSRWGALAPPEGGLVFAYPRVFLLRGDQESTEPVLHLLWAEPDSVGTGNAYPANTRLTKVFWSVLDGNQHWSTPQMLLDGRHIRWSPNGSMLVRGRDGISIEGVISAIPRQSGTPYAMYLRYDGRTWSETSVPGTEGAVYTSFVRGNDSSRYIAFIAAARSVGTDANSVFVSASHDGAETWQSPSLVSLSGTREATEVSTLVARNGTVHLVWAQNVSGGGIPQAIRHVESIDGGKTWSAPLDFAPGHAFTALRTTIDLCDNLHVVYMHLAQSGPPHLDHVRFRDGWQTAAHLFPSLTSLEPVFKTADDGRLLLAFPGRERGSRPADGFRLFTAQLPTIDK